MPYINSDRRTVILNENSVRIKEIDNAGELNYAISMIIKTYFEKEGKGNYQAINDIIGALEGANGVHKKGNQFL